MPPILDIDTELEIGDALVMSVAPCGKHGVVFEDNGETGYFYAIKVNKGKPGEVFDAVHIYNTEQITDAHIPSRLQIIWSEDSRAAALVINQHTHAIFDFEGKRGGCRTGFPPAGDWGTTHDWDEALFELFKE